MSQQLPHYYFPFCLFHVLLKDSSKGFYSSTKSSASHVVKCWNFFKCTIHLFGLFMAWEIKELLIGFSMEYSIYYLYYIYDTVYYSSRKPSILYALCSAAAEKHENSSSIKTHCKQRDSWQQMLAYLVCT